MTPNAETYPTGSSEEPALGDFARNLARQRDVGLHIVRFAAERTALMETVLGPLGAGCFDPTFALRLRHHHQPAGVDRAPNLTHPDLRGDAGVGGDDERMAELAVAPALPDNSSAFA